MAKVDDRDRRTHGPLEWIDEGVVTVVGSIRMPLGNFPRRMTVVALSGGRSAVWSPIPPQEGECVKSKSWVRRVF